MNRHLTLIILTVFFQNIAKSQPTKDPYLRPFIPGEKDSIINGAQVRMINPHSLVKGFQLQMNDTTFKIVGFRITFDHDSGISTLPSTGDRIEPRNDSIVSLSNIVKSDLITIEDIYVIKDGRRGKLPAILYYCFK